MYEPGERPPSAAVVDAVTAETDAAVEELPPLYDAVDADALDALLGDDRASASRGIRVEFDYAGYHVAIGSVGDVELTPLSPPDARA